MLLDQPIPRHITGLYVFAVINLMALFHMALVEADVTVKESNETLHIFADMAASFGPPIPPKGIKGYLMLVKPVDGCSAISPPPFNRTDIKWFAIVKRGGCDFSTKVFNAQLQNYSAVIVYNDRGDDIMQMGGGSEGWAVQINSVFVGETDGRSLSEYYTYPAAKLRYTITIDGHRHYPGSYAKFLYPFAIVVGCCFVLMVVFMVGKWCRDVRKRQRSRLSKRHLNKLEVKKFKKGDAYEVCAICLDEYEEGDKLRILPCDHAYHCKCIDPWLTKNKRVCPICKRRVFPEMSRDSDSETEGEDNGNETSTERTPLLGSGGASGSGTSNRRSTFDNSGLPASLAQECDGHVNNAATLVDETRKDQRDDDDESSTNSLLEGAVGGQAIPVETCIEVEAFPPDRVSQCSNTGSINSAESDTIAIVPSAESSPTREENKKTSFVV